MHRLKNIQHQFTAFLYIGMIKTLIKLKTTGMDRWKQHFQDHWK